ncbi:MAG: hypothetical protein LBK60_06115 [Verrucomicrobiales bacterium]|jgi:hypothetical protein|nr:hypothetical protein [Verrucomicrobiales bacterium]
MNINYPFVVIEWADSHYRCGWTCDAPEPVIKRCVSAGWLVRDGQDAKDILIRMKLD